MSSEIVERFLSAKTFAVAGASARRHKYGYKVLRALRDSGRTVYALNPTTVDIDGERVYANLAELPEVPEALSVITPPAVTRQIMAEAIAAGVRLIWMQPGAEDHMASQAGREAGLEVIDDGSCILVYLALGT